MDRRTTPASPAPEEYERDTQRSAVVRKLVKYGALAATALAGAVYGVFAMSVCGYPDTPTMRAETGARVLRMAAERLRAAVSSEECPTIAQLRHARTLDPAQPELDPWHTGYRLVCTQTDILTISAGPDRLWQTWDDIVLPRKTRKKASLLPFGDSVRR